MEQIRILALVGSLRAQSFNKSLARFIHEQMPDDFIWDQPEISALPFYNDDLQNAAGGPPPNVKAFQDYARNARAIIIVSPEYNWSMPAVIKNALDWGTRPYADNPIGGKLVMLAGATIGVAATARMQLAVRQMFNTTRNRTVPGTDIMIGHASKQFDKSGNLIDPDTTAAVQKALTIFLTSVKTEIGS